MEKNMEKNIEINNKKVDQIREELEPILRALDNDYKIKEEIGEDGTKSIVVYDRNNQIAAMFNADKSQFFDQELENGVKDYNRSREENQKEREHEVAKEEIKEKEEKEEKEKQEENNLQNIEEQLNKNTGDEYEILSIIPRTGNEEIVSKIYSTSGFVGDIYTVKNKQTGEYSLAGMKDGKIIVDSYKRIPSTIKNVYENGPDGKRLTNPDQEKSKELICLSNEENLALDITENKANVVVNPKDNPQVYPLETKPVKTISTTKEVDEMKQNPQLMKEINDILDRLVEKGYINENQKTDHLQLISKNGNSLEDDKKKLEKFEEEKDEEKELEGYDPRDPHYKHLERNKENP